VKRAGFGGLNGPGPDVLVNVAPFHEAPAETIGRGVHLVLEDAGLRDAELSVTLLGDDAIRALNREYLDRDHVTDVLAFSLGDADGPVLGDVYVGFEQARRQAAELGVDPDEEVVRLAIHGTLHVLGHDHPEGADRGESPMFALQERLLRRVVG
jgi:probable rRNA maturation factor